MWKIKTSRICSVRWRRRRRWLFVYKAWGIWNNVARRPRTAHKIMLASFPVCVQQCYNDRGNVVLAHVLYTFSMRWCASFALYRTQRSLSVQALHFLRIYIMCAVVHNVMGCKNILQLLYGGSARVTCSSCVEQQQKKNISLPQARTAFLMPTHTHTHDADCSILKWFYLFNFSFSKLL